MFQKEIFAARLFELRKGRNLSQQALAGAIDVSFHQISKMEKAQRGPSLEVACALADYFNVSLDYLCGRSAVPERR